MIRAPRFTRAGVSLASTGLGLLGLGMGMGNLELLLLSVLPLVLVGLALAERGRGSVRGGRTLSTRQPRRGDEVEVEVHARVPTGLDLVEVHAPLPGPFRLTQGTNLLLHAKSGDHWSRFRVRADGRGAHRVPAARAQVMDPLGILAPRVVELAPEERVDVSARTRAPTRARRRSAWLTERDVARLGVGSTDFRELREYGWGDPPKAINWRATARRLSALARRGGPSAATPLVNEYEKEGRRTAFVLLDGGEALRVGTSLESGIDHGVEAALTAAHVFLARGARVGAATFHARAGAVAAPDAGRSHLRALEKALSPGEPDAGVTPQGLLHAIRAHAGARPLLVVVTRVTPANAPALAEFARSVRALLQERRRELPLVVVDVRALGLMDDLPPAWRTAATFVEREDEAAAGLVRETGARVLPWRPREEEFQTVLARRGLA